MGFLDDWLGTGHREAELRNLSKHSVRSDKYDRQDWAHVLDEIAELQVADDRLAAKVETGHHAMGDTFFSAVKADPDQFDKGELNPAYLVNREVNKIVQETKELKALREYTVGDEIGAALATINMEPDLENIFDRLKNEQELAKQLAQQAQALSQMMSKDRDIDEMIQEWQDAGGDPANPDEQAANWQEDKDALNSQIEALRAAAEATEAALTEGLDQKRPSIQHDVKEMINNAADEAQEMNDTAAMWGTERGQIVRLPPEKRLELARRLSTPRMRQLAKMVGAIVRLAMAEQSRKVEVGRDEIYDIETGDDLGRVLPIELMDLRHPIKKRLFFKKYLEKSLMQYKMRGVEKVAKGSIVYPLDTSGSMMGDRELWGKAVGLALLNIARRQKRSFIALPFGSPGQLKIFDFSDPQAINPDRVLDFAEFGFNGGTDFVTPLSKCLDILREEFATNGAVKGDIVFATDGMCPVPPAWLEEFKKEQSRLGFRVYGIAIGCSRKSQPLAEICDNRTIEVHKLTTGEEVRDIFSQV